MSESSSLHLALDQHQLDASAKEDRPYLVSLLRRMGYSEIEIKHIVTGKKTLAEVDEQRADKAPEPVVEQPVEQDITSGSRLIELEFGGATALPSFEPVVPVGHEPVAALEQTEFELSDDDSPATDDAFDWDAGEPAPWPDAEPVVEEAEPEVESNEFVLLDAEQELAEFEEVFVEPEPELVEFVEVFPEPEQELVEFEEIIPEAPAEEWGDWEGADEAPEMSDYVEAAFEPDRYGKFTLYRRQLDGGQHVYFFSKKVAKDAEPATIPSGYEVQVSDDGGLPFLARSD